MKCDICGEEVDNSEALAQHKERMHAMGNEKTSLRASASCPASTSGAMYWSVPRILPSSLTNCAVDSPGDDSMCILAVRSRGASRPTW